VDRFVGHLLHVSRIANDDLVVSLHVIIISWKISMEVPAMGPGYSLASTFLEC